MARAVAGLFSSAEDAQKAIVALKAEGFGEDQLGIVLADTHAPAGNAAGANEGIHVVKDIHTPIADTESHEATAAGGIVGASIGALLAATGALIIPGAGPFIAGGILATVYGGVLGALAGAFVGLGFTKEEAAYYEAEVHAGRPLVTVKADGRAADATRILRACGAILDVPATL